MKLKIQSLVALAAMSAIALASVQGFSVKRTPKVDTSLKYNMAGTLDVSGLEVTMAALVEETVTAVGDGTYTVEQKQLSGTVSVQGQEQELPIGNPTVTIYKDNGEIESITGGEDPTNAMRLANLGALIDPGKSLAIGEKWTVDIKEDVKKGASAATAAYEVLGEEKVDNIDTIKVKSAVMETSGAEPASSESTVWLDKADGSTVKIESTWKNAPLPGAPGPVNAKITLTRTK